MRWLRGSIRAAIYMRHPRHMMYGGESSLGAFLSSSLSTQRPTSTMSQAPSTSATFTNFETIFTAALKEYKKQTKRDITSHPLATQLQSCASSSDILAVLQARVQKFDQSQGTNEKWLEWVDPTVNVLYALSATLGNGVGLVNCEISSRSGSTI